MKIKGQNEDHNVDKELKSVSCKMTREMEDRSGTSSNREISKFALLEWNTVKWW